MTGFDFDYDSLVRLNVDGKDHLLQYDKVEIDGIRYTFHHKGNLVKLSVYNETQYKYKNFMPEPKTIDYTKSIQSPMPGAIV